MAYYCKDSKIAYNMLGEPVGHFAGQPELHEQFRQMVENGDVHCVTKLLAERQGNEEKPRTQTQPTLTLVKR